MKKLQLLLALSIAGTATADFKRMVHDLNPFADPMTPINEAKQSTKSFSQDNPVLFNTVMNLCQKLKLESLPFKNSPYLFSDPDIDSIEDEYDKLIMKTTEMGNITVEEYCMLPKLHFGKKALKDLSPQELEALVAASLSRLNQKQKDAIRSLKKWMIKAGKYTAACMALIILSAAMGPVSIPVVAAVCAHSYKKGKRNLTKRADLDALKVLEGPDNLISALEKEDSWNPKSGIFFKLFGSKPRLAERIKYLKSAAAQQ